MNTLFQNNRHKPKKGLYLEYLSWDQAEPVLKESQAVILPLGSNMKQHGHHLPLNNDYLIAEYLTARILDELSLPALPTMTYGYYPAFINYPGSITLSKEMAKTLITDTCQSIARHGPKKFYIINTGFSTNHAIEPAKIELAKEGILLEYLDFHYLHAELEDGIKEQLYGSHADEIETSIMLYIHPEIVNIELAKAELHPNRKGPLTRNPNDLTGIYSATGAWGDPTLATAKKGEIIIERLVKKLIILISEFIRED